MKYAALALVALLIPAAAFSDVTETEACKGDAEIASMFMTHRQLGGMDLNTLMSRFGSDTGLRAMILNAFEVPVATTASARKNQIAEFGNAWEIRCYRDGPTVPVTE